MPDALMPAALVLLLLRHHGILSRAIPVAFHAGCSRPGDHSKSVQLLLSRFCCLLCRPQPSAPSMHGDWHRGLSHTGPSGLGQGSPGPQPNPYYVRCIFCMPCSLEDFACPQPLPLMRPPSARLCVPAMVEALSSSQHLRFLPVSVTKFMGASLRREGPAHRGQAPR